MESSNDCEDIMNVCRLCLGTDSLMSIFDDRIKIPENMKDVIQITTGVTISPSDDISQKLCYKCVNITIRMFKFRTSSIVNNLELKEKAALRKNRLRLHKSVRSLYIDYPRIILPSSIGEINISPTVNINKDEIDNWKRFCRKKKTLEKIRQNLVQQNNGDLARDLEKDIMPHIITNAEKSENRLKNPGAEEELVELNASSPLLPTPLSSVNENAYLTAGPSSVNNIANEDLNNKAIENQATVENKGKRKINLSMNKHETKKVKLDLGNHEPENSVNSLLDLKYVNECIYLCDICNNILYNVKDLKRHKNKHMRCNLCKKSFRSLRETEEHSGKHCPIKHMMTNSPIVRLQRCDESDKIRKQYPSAFGMAPEEDLDIKPNVLPEETQDPTDGISLISDEEDTTLASNDNREFLSNELINVNSDAADLSREKTSIRSASQEKCEKRNVSCCKPDLEITGDNILSLNLDDEEISLVRNLLKRTKKNIKESCIQTDHPNNNCDIIASLNKDKLFEMRNLREYLHYYKIPVNVSYATQYTAKYGNDPSLVSKYHHFDWSVMKTKRKPSAPTSHDKVKITTAKQQATKTQLQQNTTTKVSNEESKSVSSTPTLPPLFLIRTQSQTNSPALYAVAVQNVQSNTSATRTSTDAAKQTECTSQNKHHAHTTSSGGDNCGSIQNNFHIRNNGNTNIQIGTNMRNNANIQNNANIRNNTGVHNNTNVRNVISCNEMNRTPPVISKSNSQIQMNSRKSDSATPSITKLQNNVFTLDVTSTNSSSKEVQKGKSLVSLPSVSHNRGILSSTQNNNILNGTTFTLTNSVPRTLVNNPSLRKNNSFIKGRNAPHMQHHGVNSNYTVVASATSANSQRNGSAIVNTSFNSSSNLIRIPTVPVTTGISNVFQNNFRNVPAVSSHKSYMNIPNIAISNSKTSSPNSIFLGNIPNVNNHPRTSTYIPPSNTQPNNSSILSQRMNSAIPPTSFPIHMPPPSPPPLVVSQQSTKFSQRTDTFTHGTKTIDQNGIQSTFSTTSSSQNGNNFVPMIRVRNVSELR